MTTSDFKRLQKEVCSPELEPPPLKKLCAPCVPNQSYIEPDWTAVEVGEPYLNEKQCEYQVTVTVNKFGDTFNPLQFRNLEGDQETFASQASLLKSFIHPAIVLILEETGKLIADQIICATFPIGEELKSGEKSLEIGNFEVAYMKILELEVNKNKPRCKEIEASNPIDPSEPFDFNQTIIGLGSNEEIENPYALELYARVKDYYIDPIDNVLKVHIGVPSFIVDQIPELPSKEELEEEAAQTREEVLLDVKKLFGQVSRLAASLRVFGKYQSYFYQNQDGFLKFRESEKDFYSKNYSIRLDKFYSALKQLAEKNDINIRSNIPSLTKLNADKVRIEFKTGPNGNPYVIKSVYAWKEGCEEKKLRKGIKKFKQKFNKQPTLMNYVAKINDIDMTLQARETTPWLDFLVQYTYPLIVVDYGSLNMESVEETMGKCVAENAREFGGELRDYILNEALSMIDAMAYQYSSAASCEELYSKENQPEEKEFENIDFGLGEGLEARRKTRDRQDAAPDKAEDIAKKIIELDRRSTLIRLEIEKLEGEKSQIEENLDSGISSQAELTEINKLLNTVKKSGLDTTIERNRLNSKLRTLRGEDGERKQEEKEKNQRKSAAKIARRNAKSHPYAKKAAKIAMEEIKKSDGILSSLVDWEEYEETGKPSFKKLKDGKDDKDKSKDLISRLSICSLNAITVNAIRCVFSGVTKERAFDKMFKAAMQAMDLDVFGFFIGGLPAAAQAELRKKFNEDFGEIPLPWEEEYESGSDSKNQYKTYLGSREQNSPSIKDLPEEEKIKLIEEQKKAQGTFGTALGDAQKEIVNAYIEYIFDVMNIEEIGDALSQVPGGKLVFNSLDSILKCSTQGLFHPPLKSFLSSLSLDVCGPDRHVGLAVPEFQGLPEISFSKAFFITKLKNTFITKMETIITKVITMLLLKLFETLDNALCKSLNAVGQAAAALVTGGPQAGLDQAFADAFCPDADEDELNNIKKNAFGNALGKGAVPDEAYECLFKAINGTMSKREIIDLLTNTPSNMDDATASKFALLVNSKCPELSDILGDPDDVKDAFGSMGKFIPPELKDFLQNQPNDDLDAPIYDAICLTQDELDQWNKDRKQLYLDSGLDEDTADELINKANDRALDNLGSLADIAQKGPGGLLEDAINAALKQPDCNDGGLIVLEDEELAQDKKDLMNNYFKRIETKFLQDLIGERASLIGNILIDTRGNHLQQHNRRVNLGDRTVLYADYVDSEEQWDQRDEDAGFIKKKFMDKDKMNGMFPESIGISMLNQMKKMNLSYRTDDKDPQVKMSFNAKRDQLFNIDEYIETVLKYRLNHNEKSTQRVFVKEETFTLLSKPTIELVLNARVDQVFDKKQLGLVNYGIIPNEIKLFADLLKKKSNSSTPIKTSKVIGLFDNLNSKVLSSIRDAIVESPDGDIPAGFKFGYDEQEAVNFRDLLYVNPNADPNDESTWEYTFDEEDSVLGKSATENPRVKFLDPAIHGGRYRAPKIYIEPATYNGWLGMIKTFVPQIQTCEDKDNGFLNITEIANRSKQVESNLPVDSRLGEPLECRLEVPYDRQIMPANHGLIEGIVLSTIRTYATEFIVRSLPVFGSISFSSKNYDSLISKSLGYLMEEEMSDAGVFSNVSRLAYYLLFLEQSVQVVQRQIIDGLMEETEEMREAAKIINRAQNNYEKLKFGDVITNNVPSAIQEQINKGSRIIAYGTKWQDLGLSGLTSIRGLSPYKINLARKVSVIHDTQKAAEVFLAALVNKETSTLANKLSLNMRPLPPVYDIKKYMLSTRGILDQSDIKSGFSSVEQEIIEGSSKPDYGDILSCPSEDLMSPLGTISKTIEDINKTGIMYLEKYVRVINKDSSEQVVQISEFQRMISDRSIYSGESLLSDHFGDAQIITNKLIGSIGVKFGVRLIMALPKTTGLEPELNMEQERLASYVMTGENKAYLHHIPVASYELDILDKQIKDLDLQDPNMGEDLKCYVDRLSESKDFIMLFDTILKTRSFCSIFGIYSFQNFIESVGQEEVEDEKDRRKINQGWKKRIFNDTKRLLRKQFRSVYNSQDDTRSSRISLNRDANIDFLKNLIPDIYLNIRGVGFLQRLRIVDANPFDENGEPCVNEFQKLFKE
jgi:hypothetical protein